MFRDRVSPIVSSPRPDLRYSCHGDIVFSGLGITGFPCLLSLGSYMKDQAIQDWQDLA